VKGTLGLAALMAQELDYWLDLGLVVLMDWLMALYSVATEVVLMVLAKADTMEYWMAVLMGSK
jgi:hypothetical protein